MQALLYGFKSPMLENLLAEGVGFVGGDDYSEEAVSPYGTRIRLLPVDGGPWTLPKNPTKVKVQLRAYLTIVDLS
jgi:hypothetical protein